jgi:predicted dehydrogenase
MNKIRYGVIGIKGFGLLHCQFAKEHKKIELVAVADNDEEAVKLKSKELKVKGFVDYREMLESGIVDAISIVTPHYLHSVIGIDCLKAGVHIFVEKPIAIRISEADRMIRIAKSNNLKICVGHQYRVHRTSRTMKYLLDTGAVGRIIRVLWTWGLFRPEKYFSEDVWRKTVQQAGGGILFTHAIHDLDLICWMIGKPIRVNAMLGNQVHDIEGEDMVCANILFENDAIASFQATVNQPEGYSVRQIAGDKGILVIQDLKSMTFDYKDRILYGQYDHDLKEAVTILPGKLDQPKIKWNTLKPRGDPPILKKFFERIGIINIARKHGLGVLMDNFIKVLLDGGDLLVDGQSAATSLELANAVVLSALRNKIINLPLNRDEYDELFDEMCSGKVKVLKYRA